MIEIAFRAARPSDVAVHRQLAAHLRALVETGRPPGGTKLPATRELARALRIARNTVTQAYEQLVVQGRLGLSFTNLSTERIVEGVEGLAAAVRATLRTPPVAKPARTRVPAAAVAGRGSR